MRRFEHKDNQRQLNKYFQVGEVMCVYVYMCVCMCVCVCVCHQDLFSDILIPMSRQGIN